MTYDERALMTKVPAITLGFWIIKILATTLGETGGDTVSMTLDLGYLVGTAIFLTILVALVAWQIAAKKFHPFLYWATIIASTTAGTTMADFATRSMGIGYTGGSALLLALVLASLAAWRWALGSVSVDTVRTPKAETFYWVTITFSQTLGTALGDWTADTSGLGYGGGALFFGAGLAVLAALYFWTRASRVFLFWAAFILTRPLGATVGDLLDKPLDQGGLAFSRPLASAVLAVAILACILILPQRAGRHPGRESGAAARACGAAVDARTGGRVEPQFVPTAGQRADARRGQPRVPAGQRRAGASLAGQLERLARIRPDPALGHPQQLNAQRSVISGGHDER